MTDFWDMVCIPALERVIMFDQNTKFNNWLGLEAYF